MKYEVTIKLPIYAPFEFEQLSFKKVLYARNDKEYFEESKMLSEVLKLVSGQITSVVRSKE